MLKLKKIQPEKWDKEGLDRPYLPSLNFDSEQVPEIKEWKVGEEYIIVLKVKQTNMSEYKDQKANAGFDIVAYKVLDEDYDEEDLEELQGKALAS